MALGRLSFLAQSSDARVGGFGVAGDETAALVTLAALRVTARTGPARDGSNALGVEASFESAHALDVSGTLAGEAERMAAGVTLSDRFADAGVPLAVQVVGRRGADHLTVAVASELERAFGGWRRADPSWSLSRRELGPHSLVRG